MYKAVIKNDLNHLIDQSQTGVTSIYVASTTIIMHINGSSKPYRLLAFLVGMRVIAYVMRHLVICYLLRRLSAFDFSLMPCVKSFASLALFSSY